MKVTNLPNIVPIPDHLLILGAPGIGKTEIVRQIAEKEARLMGRQFVDLREVGDGVLEELEKNAKKYYFYYRISASQILSDDLAIPQVRDSLHGSYVKFIPPRVLYLMSLPDAAGLLFIDEVTHVHLTHTLAALLSLVYEKEVSWTVKLRVKIVMAANPAEFSSLATPLPAPLLSRLVIIRVEPPDVEEWIQYMDRKHGDEWERAVGTYLLLKRDDFLRVEQPEGIHGVPTPRSWEMVATLLHRYRGDDEVIAAIASGTLGPEVGARLVAFLRTRLTEEEIERVLRYPEKFNELDESKKLLFAAIVAARLDSEKAAKWREWAAKNAADYLLLAASLLDSSKKIKLYDSYGQVLVRAYALVHSA
jgi:MoxR-like ATPase